MLYEVITKGESGYVSGTGIDAIGDDYLEFTGNSPSGGSRITSYNVCYTKLLRTPASF